MTLLDNSDFVTGGDANLVLAEVLVAQHICPALSTLEQREFGVTLTPPRIQSVISQGLRQLGPESLTAWPVTGVISATENGSAVDVTHSRWSITRANGHPFYGVTTVRFLAGWTAETLPDEVRLAVQVTAASLAARPDSDVRQVSTDELTVSWSAGAGPLPAAARALLRGWTWEL